MTPVRLEHAALRSGVKHSTTEPLRSRTIMNDNRNYIASLCNHSSNSGAQTECHPILIEQGRPLTLIHLHGKVTL